MPEQPSPPAVVTPTRAKPGHEEVPPSGLDAKGGRVAFGAAIAVGKHRVKEHRGKHDSRDEDRAENDDEEQSFRHTLPRYFAARRSLLSRAPAAARLS